MSRRRVVIGSTVVTAALALVVGVSAVWPGLDARDTPPVDTGVWALQTGEGSRYARVNSAVGELDTVREVVNPSGLVQNAADAYILSTSSTRITRIDASSPQNLDEEAVRDSPTTPEGTAEVATSGDFVAYRTDAGAVFAGRLSEGVTSQVDPLADVEKAEDAPDYAATAITVTPDGQVFAYSDVDDAVLRYSIPDAKISGSDGVDGVGSTLELTAVGTTWFLFDADQDELWQRGVTEPRKIETVGNVALATPLADGESTYIADEGGLIRVPLGDEPLERVIGGPENDEGSPARPTMFEGDVYAAWLGTDGGTMWRSSAGEMPLKYGEKTLEDSRRPLFVASGSTLILNDTRSGWVWRMPTGALIPSSQDWSIDDDVTPAEQVSEEQAEVVLEPKPPVAVDDAFGVRAGAVVSLPVLLNDHDPNVDVLTIQPSSITGLDPAFGTVGVTDDSGRLSVTLTAEASGSASFSYVVTDGTTADGLVSETATVTLTAMPEVQNAAPEFCGVDACLATWPQPQVAPGGSLTTSVLNGWVDPEGDPLLVMSATVPAGKGAAAVTMTGDVVYQHNDPSVTATEVVPIEVTISDARGAQTVRVLKVTVTPTPELVATSFAETAVVGADMSVDVASHVTGASGGAVLKSALLMDDPGDADATPAAGSTRFDFTAKNPGTYRVRYTISDGTSEADAIVRITLLAADAPAQLATPPVVAFIRPQEDATVDVLAAVSNPTGRVLLVNDIEVEQADGALLQANAVGQNFIRVSGTTASDEPGRLGVVTYTVSDGSTDAGASITGQAAVYLLPPVSDLAPIATDDALMVRAGAQIDIPVLANDVAPSGAALLLDPSTVRTSDDSALAFAAGSELRYLAPTKPGAYTVEYGVYAAGTPSVLDRATVRVTVIGDETNRAPRPKVLAGRVLSGQTTRIDFSQYGVDPDGDQVVLDRIVTQPARGTASITPDGQAIVYASNPGSPGGQDTFTYRVTDAAGESRDGVARVGVLDEQSNPAPITFTDYVQVTAGQQESTNVSPLQNDVDPTNGTLTISDVIPNISAELGDGTVNPEYTRWKSLLTGFDEETVTVAAGATTGTVSYLYDVVSSSGNTERGLIIVKTVSEIVQDYPVVTDTVLTTENRDTLTGGVDVLQGKVAWTGGDASDLTLSLWQRADGITAKGWKLAGDPGDAARLIPFTVSGHLSDGTAIKTYGFLRVPAADDLTVSLRAGTAAVAVEEKKSVDIDMHKLVVMPPKATLEVDSTIATTGARGQATCSLSGAATVTYSAGEGAPWADACIVPVRVAGQEEWTYLSVPIAVKALDPVPVLRPASITVIPGSSTTFDLASMVTWQGRDDWDNLRMEIGAGANGISLTRDGDTVTATAADNAVPGQKADVDVTITSHAAVVPSRLTVMIGPAPSDLPRAGNVSTECVASQGTSCSIPVIGQPGESNPFPQTPLVLRDVSASSCGGVVFSVADGGTIAASWQSGSAGTSCTVRFTLEDAQGRMTNGDRVGTLTFRLKGYPQAPDAITQVGYGSGSLTLQVSPGAAQLSSPGVTGFRVSSDALAAPITCDASGACPAISAANGAKAVYSVVALNEVGASADARQTTAWAYAPPAAPKAATATPTVTDGAGQSVDLSITGVDAAATASLLIQSANASDLIVPVGDSAQVTTAFAIGTNTSSEISITPMTRFEVPPGAPTTPDGGSTTGGKLTLMGNGIGAPVALTFTAEVKLLDFATSDVTVTASAQPGGTGATVLYSIITTDEQCDPASATMSPTRTFKKLAGNRTYQFAACAYSVGPGNTPMYGKAEAAWQTVQVKTGDDAPQGYTYTVAPDGIRNGNKISWMIASLDGPTPEGYTAVYTPQTTTVMGADPGITVQWRSDALGNLTQPGKVAADKQSPAPYQVFATWELGCTVGGTVTAKLGSKDGGAGAGTVTLGTFADIRFLDDKGKVVPVITDGVVPDKAVKAESITVTVDRTAPGWNLNASTISDLSTPCAPPVAN